MKKIFTLAIGSLFSLAVMAADHKPTVTVKSSKSYEIVIDGKHYSGSNYIDLSGLYPGFHTVKVYDVKGRSFFRKKSKLISSADFSLKNSNVIITVDRFGKVDIDEQRPFFNDNDHSKGWGNSKDDHDKNGFGRDDHRNDHKKQF
ncbi:MAG: hypothetical protein ABUT20_23370 [Bacteroidota bacterium]